MLSLPERNVYAAIYEVKKGRDDDRAVWRTEGETYVLTVWHERDRRVRRVVRAVMVQGRLTKPVLERKMGRIWLLFDDRHLLNPQSHPGLRHAKEQRRWRF